MVVFTFVCSWLFVSCAVIFGVLIFALAMELTILYAVGEPLVRTDLMLLSLSVGSPIRLAWWFLSSCKMTFVFGVRVDVTIFYWKINMVFDLYLRHMLVLVFFIAWCPHHTSWFFICSARWYIYYCSSTYRIIVLPFIATIYTVCRQLMIEAWFWSTDVLR